MRSICLVVRTQILNHVFLILQWALFPEYNKDWDYIGASSIISKARPVIGQKVSCLNAAGLGQCLAEGKTNEKTVLKI